MTKPVVKLPDSKGGWASLLLGIGLLFTAAAHGVAGDYQQASLDLAGAFGTLGLPAIFGRGYHVEIRRDRMVDTSPPPGWEGTGRLTASNEEIDGLLPPRKPTPTPTPRPGAEVRRTDEL